jgi:hypothetical protein
MANPIKQLWKSNLVMTNFVEFPLSFSILFICLKHFETAWQSQGYWSEASSAQIDAAAPSDLTAENSSIAGSLSLCKLENGLK